ncbi:MAG: hypothetical protein JJU27_11465 [Gammaproteobacteria bacterium]|nr:hypothetical protein [Gammaproteobacteria bacterium]
MAMFKSSSRLGRIIPAFFALAMLASSMVSAQSRPNPPLLSVDGQIEAPTESAGLTARLNAEYVDPTGVRRSVSTSGESVVIRGIAPFLVAFDASDSRAPAAFSSQSEIADEEAYAFLMVGYRLNYGDQIGGIWRYPQGANHSRNEDTGPPIFSRVYREPGTYTARLLIRDELGAEDQVQLTVIVEPPANTVHIPVSAGQWPNWVNGTRYTLQAGADYRSFGSIDTGGRHNISIEKTGSGSDPRVSTFSPDGRSKWSATSEFEYRASHIRLVGIDFNHFSEGQRGFDYVGVIDGRMRRFSPGGQGQLWHEGDRVHRSNTRHARGLFLQDTEVNNIGSGNGYIMFGTFRGFYAQGTRFHSYENGSTTWLMLRVYGSYFSFRNNLWYLGVDGGAANGTTLSMLSLDGVNETVWRDDDTVGPLGSSSNGARYGYIGEKQIAQHNQYYAEGSYLTNGIVSTGGNPSGERRVRPRLVGWEDNVWYPSGAVSRGIGTALGGNYVFWRNNSRQMGSGSYIQPSTFPPNNIQGVTDTVTYHGPYLLESTNSRPVPSGF